MRNILALIFFVLCVFLNICLIGCTITYGIIAIMFGIVLFGVHYCYDTTSNFVRKLLNR